MSTIVCTPQQPISDILPRVKSQVFSLILYHTFPAVNGDVPSVGVSVGLRILQRNPDVRDRPIQLIIIPLLISIYNIDGESVWVLIVNCITECRLPR
jgi:hypothetical protein